LVIKQKIGRVKTMRKTIQTLIVTFFVVLITASFAFAANAITGEGNFPYFNLGCLIMGGLTIVSIKHRYPKMYLSEAIGSFALYAVLVALFTAPVIESVKYIVS
jgi:membrane protein implicated in regulation of membrane protease activity